MLNWIVWNRNVFTFNCVNKKTVLMLNWIVWNRMYLHECIYPNIHMNSEFSFSCTGYLMKVDGFMPLLRALLQHEMQTASSKIECYGISTLVGYLMSNPVFTYISNIFDS